MKSQTVYDKKYIKADGFDYEVKIPKDKFDLEIFKNFINLRMDEIKDRDAYIGNADSHGTISGFSYRDPSDADPIEVGYFEAYLHIDWWHNRGLSLWDNKTAFSRWIPIQIYLATGYDTLTVIYSAKHPYIKDGYQSLLVGQSFDFVKPWVLSKIEKEQIYSND